MFLKSIFFTLLLCQSFLFASSKYLLLCVEDKNNTVASVCLENNTTSILHLADKITYDTAIFEIQTKIRKLVKKDKSINIILLAKGIVGTLSAIAQGNMLPFYRKHIKGLILEDAYATMIDVCPLGKKSKSIPSVCQNIQKVYSNHKEASLYEVIKSLSPSLQMDWFYPKVLLAGNAKDKQYKSWMKAFNENSITYVDSKKLDTTIIQKFISTLLELPKDLAFKIPTYYGPILRFHLGKIYYKSKHELTILHNESYGNSKQQTYDVYFKKNSIKDNKLLVYVHGGGWVLGSKSDYTGFAKQFSDKGFTVVSVDYRYLKLPNVTMKDIVGDIKNALHSIMQRAEKYHFSKQKVAVMGESTGAYLLYMALVNNDTVPVKVSILNSMPSDLSLYSEKKQVKLSGIKNKKNRTKWLKSYSPLKNLDHYKVPTMAIHGLDDKVVPKKHLEALDLYSVIHHKNIETYWVLNAGHPIAPIHKSISPAYQELEQNIDKYIAKYLYKK